MATWTASGSIVLKAVRYDAARNEKIGEGRQAGQNLIPMKAVVAESIPTVSSWPPSTRKVDAVTASNTNLAQPDAETADLHLVDDQ